MRKVHTVQVRPSLTDSRIPRLTCAYHEPLGFKQHICPYNSLGQATGRALSSGLLIFAGYGIPGY